MKRALAIAAEAIIAFGLTLALVPPIVRATVKYGWWFGVLAIIALIVVGSVARVALEMYKINRTKGRKNSN